MTGADAQTSIGIWGRIANDSHLNQRVTGALFFAGPPPSTALYTRHPKNASKLDWSNDADIEFALGQMTSVGLNTIKLSYWGNEGETDSWSPSWLFSQKRWPGDYRSGNYTEAEQAALALHFFQKAASQSLLVSPMLEVSPRFPFYAEFPSSLDNMVARSVWLLKNFGAEPNWLRLYDSTGQPRFVIWLIESIHAGAIDAETFAQGFDQAAQEIEAATGYKVGFILDPTPLPPYGTTAGPQPAALKKRASVLAINPFNIASQGITYKSNQNSITEDERQQYAESVMKKWSGSGIPFIAPVIPGYDAHIVFPDSPKFGFNDSWRERQKQLALQYASDGLTVDCWNGWTEGYAIPSSTENGDVHMRWVSDIVRRLRIKQEGLADLNKDGQVNVLDALLLLKITVGLLTMDETMRKTADLNFDGKVDTADAILLLQYVTGL